MAKRCPDCEQDLPIEAFYVRLDRPGSKPQHRCKGCQSTYQIGRRRITKQRAIEYLGGACSICGYHKCSAALDFHHRDRKTKDTRIALLTTLSWERVVAELDKCDLVCANCHREIEVDYHR